MFIPSAFLACQSGYFGPNCSLPCRYPNYGLQCQLECKCKQEQNCNHITGCQSTSTCIYYYFIFLSLSLFLLLQSTGMSSNFDNVSNKTTSFFYLSRSTVLHLYCLCALKREIKQRYIEILKKL